MTTASAERTLRELSLPVVGLVRALGDAVAAPPDGTWDGARLAVLLSGLAVLLGLGTLWLVWYRRKPVIRPASQILPLELEQLAGPVRRVSSPTPSMSSASSRRAPSERDDAVAAASPGAHAAMGATAVAASGGTAAHAPPQPHAQMACPSCRREFEAGVRFCPYDSRHLVLASEIGENGRSGGSVCPRCRRAFDAGIRYCPHDAEELLAAHLWEASQGRRDEAGPAGPTGVMAKICPRCQGRYDLATTFCGKDGAELVTIN